MKISDEERREAVEFLRSGKCLYFDEHRKTELDCNQCMKVSTMLFGHYDARAGWTAVEPIRGKDLPTSLTARARISSVLGELVSGA